MSLASQEIPTIQLVTLTDEGIQAGCDPMCAPACAPVCSPSCSPCFPAATPGRCNPELFCGHAGLKCQLNLNANHKPPYAHRSTNVLHRYLDGLADNF